MNGKIAVGLLAFGIAAGAQGTKDHRESLLNYSITGSTNSSSPAENATYAMEHIEVQRLLLDVAASPRDPLYVEAALRGSGISPGDMLSNGSLRLEKGQYWLNFGLLTRADQEILVRAAATYSQRLADAVLARRAAIDALLRPYDLAGVDRGEIAFFVLGCYSLDWDGLRYATGKGYRAAAPKRKGGQFFVMAEERGGPSLKQIYWGSNNEAYGGFGFTTFGDHFSPRTGLSAMRRNGPESLRAIPFPQLAMQVGAIMLALRDGARLPGQLADAAKIPPQAAGDLLTALSSIGYVRQDGERFGAAIPVLAMRDRSMVDGLRRIGFDAMVEWFNRDYPGFRSAMSGISPVRNRVPFPVAFDQLWHYLFGIANQKLVEAGLFTDPYAPGSPHPGYVP
ncbi:MAG: hypothetical protein KGN36_12735, partial [Acidobacteriota bacterium]|nr:hypothetical protein [Acidobacteriota bacterium]